MLYTKDASDTYTPGAGTGVPAASPTPTASAPAIAPAPASPAGSLTLPGYTPDWNGLVTSDPTYLSASANATNAQAQAAARRKQQLQQALIQYGGKLPAGFSDQYGDIDQATQDQASNNQFSTLANLARNYSKSEDQFKRSLAARGALQSGDLNYGEDQLQQAYGQQQYDAANAVGSQVNQALQGYTGTLGQNAENLTAAIQGAEGNVYSNPAYRTTEPTTANYDAGNSAAYGQPIYVDSNGNLYDQNRNPFVPPAPSASAAPGGSSESSPYTWGYGGKV